MTKHLERRILLLQILLGMVCCTSLSFLSLLLSRFGFNNLQIGLVMMAAACSTSIAKPRWGVFTDRVPCARRILVVTLALGIASFTLLGTLGGASKGAAVVFVLLVEVTTGCMMGVVDSWIAKLIGTGCKINYGLTRAGISGAYAVSAACFGTVLDQYGVLPGAVALFVLLGLIALTVQGISLAGIYRPGKGGRFRIPAALAQYLKDNPGVRQIVLCLDNDEPGRTASAAIKEALAGYAVIDNPPRKGKDYNEYLQIRQQAIRKDRARA